MSEKKEIKIDPSVFGYGGSKRGSRGTTSKSEKKKKEMLVNVNGGSVKELLLRKLREYKKNKTKKLVQHHESNQQAKINPDFLERIRKRKQKTENSINMDNHYDMFQNVQNTFQDRSRNNEIIQQHNINNYQQHHQQQQNQNNFSSNSISKQPPYGVLKNGNLPTFRSFHNQTVKKPSLVHDIQQDKTNITNSYNTNNIFQSRTQSQPSSQPKSNKEIVKLQIERKLKVGRNKTLKKCGIFIRNNISRKNVEDHKLKIKQHNLRTVKNHLKRNNLIKHGCSAPNNLLREIYESTQLIGDVENKNSKNMVHNFFENNDENV